MSDNPETAIQYWKKQNMGLSARRSGVDIETLDSSLWRRNFLAAYVIFGILHEGSHFAVAKLLGYGGCSSLVGLLFGRICSIPSLTKAEDWEIDMVRHAGWITSVLVALAFGSVLHRRKGSWMSQQQLHSACLWAAVMTALEGISTDLLSFASFSVMSKTTFLCGNFGVILLNPGWTNTPGDYGKTALDLLEKMIEITMMRGAQTGGVITWTSSSRRAASTKDITPIRVRVVNGKRTDLSEQLRKDLNKKICSSKRINPSIRCLMGHTRFATSSKATMNGTHPHIWSPAGKCSVYSLGDSQVWLSTTPKPVVQSVSSYITHNGDLDFFKINGVIADLEAVQKWLEKATGHPMPAPVDSAAIAGLVDLIRSAGCFALSLRFARVIASPGASVSSTVPFPFMEDYSKLGKVFEMWLPQFCSTNNVSLKAMKSQPNLRRNFAEFMISKIHSDFDLINSAFTEYSLEDEKDVEQPAIAVDAPGPIYSLRALVIDTVDAFLDNDLFFTTKYFMRNAVGSFGLMVTCSMDASRQICIAARGQPMSVGFFPEKGIICYGSELAAVKAGMTYDNPSGNIPREGTSFSFKVDADMTQETCRFDLDDLGGEVVLLDYSGKEAKVTTFQESVTSRGNLRARITPLHKNDFLIPLTPAMNDQILDDIQTIPQALERIQNNWRHGGLNRMAAWNLGRCLKRRLGDKVKGIESASGIDILVTGCEVSLYLSEQFVSDLQKSFPKLKIQATSSNKLLGIFGQELAVPAVGFPMSNRIPDLKKSIVIIVSHSGGTFGPLAISNLLQSVTTNIFVVASEWDTQIG
jgi:hypothetical protein